MPSGEWVFEQADALIENDSEDAPQESEFDNTFGAFRVDYVSA